MKPVITQRTEYFFPDDVIVTVGPDGTRSARLGFDCYLSEDHRTLTLTSSLPVVWRPEDLAEVIERYKKAWLNAREQYRAVKNEAFLSKHASVQRDRASWAAFIDGGGSKNDIQGHAKWDADTEFSKKHARRWLMESYPDQYPPGYWSP